MKDYYEEKYDDLLREYRRLERKNEELESKLSKARDELYSAEFKIRNELEPRIASKRRAYDNWATDPERH